MSKSTLKKELANMDIGQLRQIILDAYDARKETKEYFEFFLNPDVDKLLDRYNKTLDKELNRTKWGQSKARVTNIKNAIKDVVTLNPGVETVLKMYLTTFQRLGQTERYASFTSSQENLVVYVLKNILVLADKSLMVDETLEKLNSILKRGSFSRLFTKLSNNIINNTLSDLPIGPKVK